MKKFLAILISLIVFSCSKEKPKLKTETVTEYSVETELGELVKGEINSKYSIGFYPNGTQEFFVGLIGYSQNSDTIKFDENTPGRTEIIDNKTFIYNQKNELSGVTVEKGDTIIYYNADDLENPSNYSVFDKKKRLIVQAEFLMGEKKTYTKAKYNKYGDCTYAVIRVDYEPNSFDKKYNSELEIAKKRADRKKILIFEADYDYY